MKYLVFAIVFVAASMPGQTAMEHASQTPLTLEDCIRRVLTENPQLAEARHNRESKRNHQRDIKRLPNPELEVELENFGRTGALKDVEMGEHTIFISQPVPLGGKRRLEQQAAAVQFALSDLRLLRQQGDLVRQTRNRFTGALLARELLTLGEDDLKLATEMQEMISRLHDEGAVSESDLRKATLYVMDTGRKAVEARTVYRQSIVQLTELWGGQDADLIQPAGDLKPAGNTLRDNNDRNLTGTVHQLIYASEARAAETADRLAGKLRIPDVTLRGGYKTFHDTDEHAFIAGVSVQLPVFNTGKWKAGAARAEALQKVAAARGKLTALETRLRETRLQLDTCRETGRILETEMLPIARTELESAKETYREGLFNYLQVLESLRSWTDLRKEIARSRARSDQLLSELAYLTLRP